MVLSAIGLRILNGWYQALIQARIPFELVQRKALDAAHVSQFTLFSRTSSRSDAQCAQIREFVQRGGSVIATHETSLCDEFGVRRGNFGLADLFGVNYRQDPAAHAKRHLRLEQRKPRIIIRCQGLEARRESFTALPASSRAARPFPPIPLTLIPSYRTCRWKGFPRLQKTDIAQVFLREVGKGRVIYFPWDIDRTFWEVLTDHGRILRNAIA